VTGRHIAIRPAADRDLDELAAFIAKDDIGAALRFYDAVARAYEQLLDRPGIAPSRDFGHPRLNALRMWPVPHFPNHLIFYRPVEDGIEIVRVLHAARDIASLLGDD
jgi:toxin ParE1/3/4